MTKTIRLNGERYQIHNTSVKVFQETKPEVFDHETGKVVTTAEYDYVPTKYKIGIEAVLYSRTDVSVNAIRGGYSKPEFELSFDLDGISGNSNRNIKSTTGWRGTTNDVSVYAHGIVKITKIWTFKNGDVAVTVKG